MTPRNYSYPKTCFSVSRSRSMAPTEKNNLSSAAELDPRQTLVQQLKSGDPRAWELLYELYAPLICHWAKCAGVTCEHEQENVVQDVFTKVIRHLDSYQELEGRGSFPAWLYTITRNHINSTRNGALSTVGGSGWQKRMHEIPFPKSPAQRFDSVWEREQQHVEQKNKLVSKIFDWMDQRFKTKQRNKAVIKELLMDNKSANEIAEDHKVTTNVIYQIKSRVMAQIREKFGDLENQPDSPGNSSS